ncbi:hypothetical protein OPV22_002465 [Ensete ventricosum]|uniref:Uncharacterized protein n=1 Tax=Ensete ventricosum TaxID=4639 RepID=A0AAV8RY33_ENSVE|nr:hypothetical protein OPV22_002465 [Ensete ventricosum]
MLIVQTTVPRARHSTLRLLSWGPIELSLWSIAGWWVEDDCEGTGTFDGKVRSFSSDAASASCMSGCHAAEPVSQSVSQPASCIPPLQQRSWLKSALGDGTATRNACCSSAIVPGLCKSALGDGTGTLAMPAAASG